MLKKVEILTVEDGVPVINTSADYDWSDWMRIEKLEAKAKAGDKEAQRDLDLYYPARYSDEPEPKYEVIEDLDEYSTCYKENETLICFEPRCSWCKWYNGDNSCKAFPSGIPLDIWRGKRVHDKPIPGDNGYQYSEEQ